MSYQQSKRAFARFLLTWLVVGAAQYWLGGQYVLLSARASFASFTRK
jgi:hypothetical protein